jgi:tetratricopeptide (TPR) repeat protein
MNWAKFSRITEWAAASAKVGNENDKASWRWKIQIARTIFTVCKYDQEATDAAKILLKEVRNLDENLWEGSVLACQTIAEQLRLDESYSQAQKILEKATRRIIPIDTEMRKSKSDSLLAAIALLDLGDLYWRRNDHEHHQRDRAKERYQRSLKFDATRYTRYIRVLRHYREAGLYSYIIDFVEKLTYKRKFNKAYLKRLVYDFLTKDEFQKSMLSDTKQNKWRKVVDRTFAEAIEAAEGSHMELFHIMKTYGNILHRCGDKKREDDVVSKWQTALQYGQPLASTTSAIGWPDIFSVIDPLAYIYLKRAEKALGEAKAAGKADSISTETVKTNLDTVNQYLGLIQELKQKTDIWMNTSLTCCLARYHTIAGEPQRVKSLVSKVVAASIGILSDNDESNDWFAYLQLGRIMEALQDKRNSEKAWKRVEKLMPPRVNLSRWSLCDECKQSIHLHEGVHVCLKFFQLKFFHSGCYDNLNNNISQSQRVELHKVAVVLPNANDTNVIVTAKQKQKRETSLSHWKTQLEQKYVRPEDHGDTALGSPISGIPSTPDVRESQDIPTALPPAFTKHPGNRNKQSVEERRTSDREWEQTKSGHVRRRQ